MAKRAIPPVATKVQQESSSVIKLAKHYGKMALVDMCSVKDMKQRGKEVKAMGPDYICCHVGYGYSCAELLQDMMCWLLVSTR